MSRYRLPQSPALLAGVLFALATATTWPADSSWPFQLLPKPDNYNPPPTAPAPTPANPTPPPVAMNPGELVPTLGTVVAEEPGAPNRLYVSPDGTRLVILRPRVVEIRDAASRGLLAKVAPRHLPRALAFATGGQIELFGEKGGLSRWDCATAKMTNNFVIPDLLIGPQALGMSEFDAAGSRLAMVGTHEVGVFDTSSRQWLWKQTYSNPNGGELVAISPDGKSVAVNYGDGRAGIYDGDSGKLVAATDGFPRNLAALEFSPDSRTLATATQTHGVQIWDATTGKLELEIKYEIRRIAGALTFSPDGRRLAIIAPSTAKGGHAGEMHIGVFDLADGRLVREINEEGESAASGPGTLAAFSPDGKTLYTAGKHVEAWPVEGN